MIKLFKPYVPHGTFKAVKKALESGQLAQGPAVEQFEEKFTALFKERSVVALNSGTSALELAYELLDLGPGDEVISTPLTCAATNLPLLRRGVKIVWADILDTTLGIDPLDVRAKITDKTKAVVQVHLGGVRADVGAVHLPVVSDACQALGIFNGDYTCNSFQAIKHITTGDGGMLSMPAGQYRQAKLLRWFGIDREIEVPQDWTQYKTRMMCFDIETLGTKRHMNDIAAAMGCLGLDRYVDILKHRQRLFNVYRERIGRNLPGITLVDGYVNVYWLATVLVERRDDFARMLWDAGIESNVVQIRNDQYKIFGGKRADLPVLNSIEDKYISLPIGMHVSIEDVNYICDKIEKGW